jgi:hypothetical protein
MEYKEIKLSPEYFLNKNTLIYGETGTGKSVIIKDILFQLTKHVEQCIVFSAMEDQNGTYKGIVPSVAIHQKIDHEILKEIWTRQEACATVYNKANDPAIIERLFNKFADNNVIALLKRAEIAKGVKLREIELDPNPGNREKQRKALGKTVTKFIHCIHKNHICKCVPKMTKTQYDGFIRTLTPEERFAMQYMTLNPAIAVIVDDCTDQLQSHRQENYLRKIFYAGRHIYITAVMGCHTDKATDPEMKKGVHNIIFTSKKSVCEYTGRKSASLQKTDIVSHIDACNAIFPDANPENSIESEKLYQKMLVINKTGVIYRFTATEHENFEFGSLVFRRFCEKLKRSKGFSVTQNKYMAGFAT